MFAIGKCNNNVRKIYRLSRSYAINDIHAGWHKKETSYSHKKMSKGKHVSIGRENDQEEVVFSCFLTHSKKHTNKFFSANDVNNSGKTQYTANYLPVVVKKNDYIPCEKTLNFVKDNPKELNNVVPLGEEKNSVIITENNTPIKDHEQN